MKNVISSIIILAFAMSAGSCHIYQSYKRPEMSVDNGLFRQGDVSADTVSIATVSWKEFFADEKLKTLIETGLENNTDLQIAHLRVNEAEAVLMAANLSFLPSVFFNPDASITHSKASGTEKSYTLAGSASWEIDLFGKLRNARKGSEAALYQSKAYSQAVRAQLIATIANSYYTLLMLDEQLSISQRTSENWGSYLHTLNALKKNGTVNQAEISQAEASKLQTDASVLSIQQQIQSVENSLSVLLGNSPGEIDRNTLSEQKFPVEMSTGVPLDLLRNRPDIIEAEWALAQAYYTTNEARAAFYPSITLSGSAGWTDGSGLAIANPSGWLFSAVGSLLQPLFNKGQNIAQLKISKAQQEEALLAFKQSILNAGAEVNDALTQWQTAQKRFELDCQQIKSLQTAEKSTKLLMEHGTTNYLEVLIAQQSLLQAELTRVEDKFNEIQGIINLYHALGGGNS